MKEGEQGAVALVLDLTKAFKRVSLQVVWAWATHFSFPRKILRVLCGFFEHQRRVQSEGCAAEPLRTVTAILPGSKWSCLLLRIALQDALSQVIRPSSVMQKVEKQKERERRETAKVGMTVKVGQSERDGQKAKVGSNKGQQE